MVKQVINNVGPSHPNVKFSGKCKLNEGVIIGFAEGKNPLPTKIGKNSIFRAYTLVYAGVTIGDNFQTGPNVLIREKNKIGNNVVVWHGSTLNPENIIDDGSRIHAGCFLEKVTLGKNVFIGPGVVFTDDPHPLNPSPRTCFGGASVGDEAVVGANVTVLPHIKIGKRAVVGAGSVVTKDIPSGEVWVGNPAKFLKKVEDVVCDIGKNKPYKDFWKIK